MNFIIYKPSGEIIRVGLCMPMDFQNQAEEGELIMEGEADPRLHFIEEGVIVDRPDLPFSISGTLISTIGDTDLYHASFVGERPPGVSLPADPIHIHEAEFEIAPVFSGEFSFLLKKFPYKDKEFQINV